MPESPAAIGYDFSCFSVEKKFISRKNSVFLVKAGGPGATERYLVCKKYSRPERMAGEAEMLRLLKEKGVSVPQIYGTGKDYILTEYLEGTLLLDRYCLLESSGSDGGSPGEPASRLLRDLCRWFKGFYQASREIAGRQLIMAWTLPGKRRYLGVLMMLVKIKNLDLHLDYLRKWLLIATAIGVVAGVGAIAFYEAIHWSTYLFLQLGVGYTPPAPLGEGKLVVTGISRRWMIPVVTTLGGLLSGLIVFRFAPEAEGHGTDAAIEAFHYKDGIIRARVPLIKVIASAITIGSGGSAGREGPTAQIAAGFGSLMGQLLRLNTDDRRIALATGIGAGIGAIFKAPLGGALLSTEILYLEGFEIQALVPSFIASLIGYTIFASYAGYTPVFGWMSQQVSFHPITLLYYSLLGVLGGLIGILYVRTFYATRNYFRELNMEPP